MLAGVYPGTALSIITGYPSYQPYYIGEMESLFDILTYAQAENTPMVIGTLDNATTLLHDHAYAVLNTSVVGGCQMSGAICPGPLGSGLT